VGVNRIGEEPGLEYSGDSAVIDYRGEEVIDMGSHEGVEVVEIDIEALQRFRAKFNVSADADKFEIL
jgi:predicted amidohydrolase